MMIQLTNFRSLKVVDNTQTKSKEGPSYPEFLPVWDRSLHYEPYTPLENVQQPGLKADPAKPHLLPAGHKVTHLSPKFGSVIEGIQLSSLHEEGKNELALLTAQRGVLVFRDQDFAEHGPQFSVDYGKHFGPLHIHPASGHPQGFPELHIVYRGPEDRYISLTTILMKVTVVLLPPEQRVVLPPSHQ
jgi:sulfonate dioxygenase